MKDCIFCEIVKGNATCYKVWEDHAHIAFLSNAPNTEGFTVVATKIHYPSDAFALPETVLTGLVLASQKVGNLLTAKLDDVGRTGMILEGYGVDHVHSKLFPMHGTKEAVWRPRLSQVDKYFDQYEGYISSHGGKRVDHRVLVDLALKIRS